MNDFPKIVISKTERTRVLKVLEDEIAVWRGNLVFQEAIILFGIGKLLFRRTKSE